MIELEKDHDGVAVSFRLLDMGQTALQALLIPVRHNCGDCARLIRLTVHRLLADKVCYLVLILAYLELRFLTWQC